MINTSFQSANIPFEASFEVKLARQQEKPEIEKIINNWDSRTAMIFQDRLSRLEKDILQINPGEGELYTLYLSVDKESYKHENKPRLGLSIEPTKMGKTSKKLGISDTPGVGTFTYYHRDSNIFHYGLRKLNEIKLKILLNQIQQKQSEELLKWNQEQSAQTSKILELRPSKSIVSDEIKDQYLNYYKKLDVVS